MDNWQLANEITAAIAASDCLRVKGEQPSVDDMPEVSWITKECYYQDSVRVVIDKYRLATLIEHYLIQ